MYMKSVRLSGYDLPWRGRRGSCGDCRKLQKLCKIRKAWKAQKLWKLQKLPETAETVEVAEVLQKLQKLRRLRKLRTVDATEDAAIAVKMGVIFGEQDSWGKIKDFFTAILSQRRGKGDFPKDCCKIGAKISAIWRTTR